MTSPRKLNVARMRKRVAVVASVDDSVAHEIDEDKFHVLRDMTGEIIRVTPRDPSVA